MTVSISGTTPGIAVDGTGAVVNVTVTTGAGGGGGGVELGETSTTAYRGDRGKTAYDHSQVTTGNPHGTTASDVGADPAGTAAGLVDDLSGVSNQATARTNLGLGTAATAATGDFAAASHTHTGTQVSVDASGFNGNLTTSDDTVQEIAQKLDDLVIPAAGIADPGGANDDFLQRKAGAWAALTVAQVKTDLGIPSSIPPLGDLNPVWPNTTDGVGVFVLGGGSSAVLVGTVAVALGVTLLRTCTVSAVKIAVNSGGSTGAKARVGIYAAGSNGRPGSLVLDCGTVLIESGGTKTLTLGTPQQLTAGLYFFATSLDTGTSATIYGYASSTSGSQGSGGFRGAMPDNLFRSGAYSFATTGGAMTSTPTWTLGVSSGAICANIGLTIASVP